VNLYSTSFGIGELSRRTGVGISTLRAWERRHGFPIPDRAPGGHRRYGPQHVEAIHDVVLDVSRGGSVASALASARDRWLAPHLSLWATMRRALPDVPRVVLGVPTLRAISRAIEDEIAGCADRPFLFASFQDARRWRSARSRWRDLALTSRNTVVMATGITTGGSDTWWQVALARDAPAAREWTVVCDAPRLTACLVAVERPTTEGARREFEAVWTMEPHAVRAAARSATTIATAIEPQLEPHLIDLQRPASVDETAMRAATRLTVRTLGYLDTAHERSVGRVATSGQSHG